jgi:hypothetical protein
MMILFLARHSRKIAWILACSIYAQNILAAMASPGSGESAIMHYKTFWNERPPIVKPPFPEEKIESAVVSTSTTKQKNAPRQKFTTGPTQPEMQSFQSVNVNNMVDLFSGDFSYNIPLMDVGGYPVNLHYQSGITMDQEASWVGLGWNINPGTITRNMRGVPDDFNGSEKIAKTLSIKDNKTVGVTLGGNIELFGFFNIGPTGGVFHNTYKGWGTETGINVGISAGIGSKGEFTTGLGLTNNSQNGFDIEPSMGFSLGNRESKTRGSINIGTNYNSRNGIQALQMTAQVKQHLNDSKKVRYSLGTGATGVISFAQPSFTPHITNPWSSTQVTFTAKVGTEAWGLHPSAYIRGYSSRQYIDVSQRTLALPSYGYLYYQNAKGSPDAVLDINREKEVAYTDKTPHIAIPIYTYDTYSISGEGTGGMFRPYRNDVGYVYDHSISTKSNDDKFALDLGWGSVFHAGVDVSVTTTNTKNNPWLAENTLKDVIGFRERDSTFEEVYFKNPGERTSVDRAFYSSIGGDSLVRVGLSPAGSQNVSSVTASRNLAVYSKGQVAGTRTLSANTLHLQRAPRTQVITYLTAKEASVAGLDKKIRSYGFNSFPTSSCQKITELPRVTEDKLDHHISELTVLNGDGKRYVYGIPVYNMQQRDISFSTSKGDTATGLVSYTPGQEDKPGASPLKETEQYYSESSMPAYAHSYLLSGILSPDYVDITNDGITEDDRGDAIKFNYTRIYGETNAYRWRAPMDQNKASYNEGLKTDRRDEKGTISYGEREVWYLNSVESKTMIATFKLDTVVRKDSYGVKGITGGRDTLQKLYSLTEINLYTKADLLKNGSAAKPIKTVHFYYDYSLCPQNASSVENQGKLTLKKVWFTYNKNEKGKLNPYQFTYANNKTYNRSNSDRWGNYKSSADNPGSTGKEITNADYPYTLQKGVKSWDSAKAGVNASAWTLSEIKLPSGGKINVTYESDDYAYVQNKRAMQFFQIAGFSSSATGVISSNLYEPFKVKKDVANEYMYAFANIPEQVTDRKDIYLKYLEGVTKLYFRLYVRMPEDKWGKGMEYVECYADIVDYGMRGAAADKKIWLKLAPVNGQSPLAVAALQFMRLNLPSKAFPYSEPGDKLNIKDVVGMLASVAGNISTAVNGFDNNARSSNRCNFVLPEKSFVRLNNPDFKKFGGGLRVKKIEISDNWNSMTAQQESTYGMEYSYTTVKYVGDQPKIISSGVASYEPAIGNEENPFVLPIDYVEKVGALAPTNYLWAKEPFGETFFPSPSVGYSKVRVQTIHKDKKSATGIEETEFYTAYDFPVITEFTPLDKESKKPYNPTIKNFLKFDAKHYVTLSQGFKVELNDMHGKLKSQASYAQNDLKNPISYTFNYFRLENDNSARKKLSGNVAVIDSATGVINQDGLIGKDIEIMVDMREQKSSTIGGRVEGNVDWILPFPTIIIGTVIPLPSSEVNRFRSVAVMKVVNSYGILDSVIHFEKGSKVSTRNMIYDGQTGEVLLSQTNNEFDDPVYNFNYPAHWAYSGMGSAYKNVGARFTRLTVKNGTAYYSTSMQPFPVERFLESGDEILTYARTKRLPITNDICNPAYYIFLQPDKEPVVLWAIDAVKGKEGHKGIYLIDKNGVPFTGVIDSMKIIRSGRRNLSATPVGSVTSLKTPVQLSGGKWRIVFDSTSNVIATSAARFKDMWKVDSTTYAKDTVRIDRQLAQEGQVIMRVAASHTMSQWGKGKAHDKRHVNEWGYPAFEASSFDGGKKNETQRKSWLLFDNITSIPNGAIIKSAYLQNLNHSYIFPHVNDRISNASYLKRIEGPWIGRMLAMTNNDPWSHEEWYFNEYGWGKPDEATKVLIPATPRGISERDESQIDITSMAQAMVNDYYGKNIDPSILIRLQDAGGDKNLLSRLAYNHGLAGSHDCGKQFCKPSIVVNFYYPCTNGATPTFQTSNVPVPGYYCFSEPVDTFVCKPNINDTATNPYRWGMLGNWRMDRAYTYYGTRAQVDPAQATNIRTDGTLAGFAPYWAFTNGYLQSTTDTFHWVWNSELTAFNTKGFEIENHDPLDRYNSGQYGYNQTLPVAVAQNSQYRNMMFEGYEDYDYRTDTCKKCNDLRFVNLASNGTRVDTVSHTGRFSLRVPGNTTINSTIPIATYAQDTALMRLSVKLDSTAIVDTTVNGNGTGLRMEQRFYKCDHGWEFKGNTNVNLEHGDLGGGCQHVFYDTRWTGKIQAKYSGVYTFFVRYDDNFTLTVDNKELFKRIGNDDFSKVYRVEKTITLQAGKLYDISVYHSQNRGSASAILYWKSDRQPFELVPITQLYPPGTTSAPLTITTDSTWCVKLSNVKSFNATLKRFSPLQGTKIVVSAWVKQQTPCVNGNYQQVRMDLDFNSGSPASVILRPAGNIIEGWQRIEDTLTIPLSATSMTVRLKATSSDAVFFDDIRMHPFNSNMKSFVYNPVNIRLMAELDENNYATFYEYDDEGTLIRVKKETERGIKTIRETRSALLKQ